MSHNFSSWNGTAIAHMFQRLITKTNHPYNNEVLTLDDFETDYDTLKNFIKWHKDNPRTYSPYNFTQENMNEIFNLISYDVYNKKDLMDLWLKMCNV